MARDAKLTIKWDSTATVAPLTGYVQTVSSVLNATTDTRSAWLNFGGLIATQADAAAFGAQNDLSVPGTSNVPLLHSGSRDQMYLRVAYDVYASYATTTALRFLIEGTQDATAGSPVVYTLGQTVATGVQTAYAPTLTLTSVSGSTATISNAGSYPLTVVANQVNLPLTTALVQPIAVGSRVQLTGTAPTGFATSTNYYVVASTTTYIQLSATLGGAAITPTTTGTSVVAVVQNHGLAVGDLIALTTVGGLTIDALTPVANSTYQVVATPTDNTFTLGAGPGATKAGANASGTALALAGTLSSPVFRKATGGRIASVPLAPNFAGSIRLNVQGAGSSAAGGLIIASASIVYGRDSAAIG
jgi:hypothetical protein